MALNKPEVKEGASEVIPIEGVVIPPDEDQVTSQSGKNEILDLDFGEKRPKQKSANGGEESSGPSRLADRSSDQEGNDLGYAQPDPRSKPHGERPKTSADGVKTFSELISGSSRLFKGLDYAVLTLLVVGTGILVAIGDWSGSLSFLSILITTYFVLAGWSRTKAKGLPMLPVFVIQQAIIYSIPFLARDELFLSTSTSTLSMASFAVVLFLGATFAGWRISTGLIRRAPPCRFPLILLDRVNRKYRSLLLGLGFLLFALVFQLSARTGLVYDLLPGEASRLFPVVRTLADAATMLGAIVGGMVVGSRKGGIAKWSYFLLVTANLLLSAVDFRLMAGATILVACATGLAMSRRRIPWGFLVVSLLFLGFLNQSKFTMRGKYWEEDTTWVEVSIAEYPRLYREWMQESWRIMTTADGGVREALLAQQSEDDLGQSILDRIDNLGNLTYVIDAIRDKDIPVLRGESYFLTPQLLIPRFFWPDKPRSHEGQVVLNLHFQRQLTREQTEKTYVAWGALPEAVGNFGPFFGAVWVGVVIGLVLGALERSSIRQHLFSIEGLVLVGTMVKIGTAHEMVTSVFVTSLFQYVVIICFAGAVIRTFFATVDPNMAKYPPASRLG